MKKLLYWYDDATHEWIVSIDGIIMARDTDLDQALIDAKQKHYAYSWRGILTEALQRAKVGDAK